MQGRVYNVLYSKQGGSCENVSNVGEGSVFFYDTLSWTSPRRTGHELSNVHPSYATEL
jgi:hypothetical protein